MSWDIPPLTPLYEPKKSNPLWDHPKTFNGDAIYQGRDGKPMSLREWVTGMNLLEYRILGSTTIGDVTVITAWDGVKEAGDDQGGIYGTIELRGQRDYSNEVRSDSEQAARAEHDRRVATHLALQAISQRR